MTEYRMTLWAREDSFDYRLVVLNKETKEKVFDIEDVSKLTLNNDIDLLKLRGNVCIHKSSLIKKLLNFHLDDKKEEMFKFGFQAGVLYATREILNL